MQDERKEDVDETEEVEAHKRFGPSEEPPARSDEGGEDDEVEAHKRFGPSEEPPARSDEGGEDDEVEGHRWRYGPEEFGKRF